MFGKRITLFRLLGFEVRIDVSWIVVALLISWSLAQSVFPSRFEGLSQAVYWVMGMAGAAGLFASIIVHEFSHSLVARRFGLPMKGITLFIFGGVAEMENEPQSAKVEFFMAVAGPLASLLMGGLLYGLTLLGLRLAWPTAVVGVLGYLWSINLILAAFNLVPAFPLDGGRILRSALWAFSGKLAWATRISSVIGSGFGLALIFLGVYSFIRGDLISGIWLFLIGSFLRSAAMGSYQRLVTQRALAGREVREFMHDRPVAVPYFISVEQFIDDYVYKHHYRIFPVVEDDRLIGLISVRQVKEIPRNDWAQRTVREITILCSPENTVPPDMCATEALELMQKTGGGRLLVADGHRLVGILTLKDLLEALALRADLEGPDAGGDR